MKVNLIVRLEFERTYDVAVQPISHYATGNPPGDCGVTFLLPLLIDTLSPGVLILVRVLRSIK